MTYSAVTISFNVPHSR